MEKGKLDNEKYQAYLKSDEWATIKIELLTMRGYNCEVCGRRFSFSFLHVHHLTYDNLYNEEPEDLQLLCGKDHMKAHGLWKGFIAKKRLKKKKKKCRFKKKFTNKPKKKIPMTYGAILRMNEQGHRFKKV